MTRLGSVSAPTEVYTATEVDSAISTATPDASSSVKGKVQLAGDLGGTATSPRTKSRSLDVTVGVSDADFNTGASSIHTAINNAVAYILANAGRGTVFIRGGSYTLNSPVNLGRGFVSLRGAGRNQTVITLDSNSNCDMITTIDDGTQGQWMEIRDLKLNGNAANQTSGHGINIRAMNECYIENVEVFNPKQDAIRIGQSTVGMYSTVPMIQNCVLRGDATHTTGNGINLISGSSDCMVAACDIGFFKQGAGIVISGHSGGSLQQVYSWQNKHGFQVYDGFRLRMTGCLSDYALFYGLVIQSSGGPLSSNDLQITNFQSRESSYGTANTYDGIYIQDTQRSILSNIRSMGTDARYGLRIGAGVSGLQVHSWDFSGNTTGTILTDGSATGVVLDSTWGQIDGTIADQTDLQDILDTKQNIDTTLTAIAAFNTDGILTQTASDTFVGRTIVGTTNQIVITNGNGVAGNPTLSLPQNIHTAATPTFAGMVATSLFTFTLSGNINLVGNGTNPVLRIGNNGFTRALDLQHDGTNAIISTTNGSIRFSSSIIIDDAKDIALNTTTGTKIGTSTSQKLGFFNATPVVQNSATTDLGTVLSNMGFRASGTAYPITTSGKFTLTGAFAQGVSALRTTSLSLANTTVEHNFCDSTSGVLTVTLPTAVGNNGQRYTIKKVDNSANAVTIATVSSQTIDGSTTYNLSSQWKYVSIISDGANWFITSNN